MFELTIKACFPFLGLLSFREKTNDNTGILEFFGGTGSCAMSFYINGENLQSCQHEIPKVQVELVSMPSSGAKGSFGSKESICVSNIFQELDTMKLPPPRESEKVLE